LYTGDTVIPKEKRRTIMVDGQNYEYAVTDSTSIFIKNLGTGKTARRYYDNKPKWHMQYGPADIKKIIKEEGI
jgi:hypothetical protein